VRQLPSQGGALIMARWTNSRDGVARVDLRITHRLDIDELARLLALACPSWGVDDDEIPGLSAARVRNLVAKQLEESGSQSTVDAGEYVTGDHRAAVRRAYGAPDA
jgi:hypothetical protein